MVYYAIPEILAESIIRDLGMSDCVIRMVMTVSQIEAIRN